jgi:hypothetical protein
MTLNYRLSGQEGPRKQWRYQKEDSEAGRESKMSDS